MNVRPNPRFLIPNGQKKKHAEENLYSKALYAIFTVVSKEEFMRISHVEIAKVARTTLETTHEGTKIVKKSKLGC